MLIPYIPTIRGIKTIRPSHLKRSDRSFKFASRRTGGGIIHSRKNEINTALLEYARKFKEIDTVLENILEEKQVSVRERKVSRLFKKRVDTGPLSLIVPKDRVLARLREVRDRFTIDLETQAANKYLHNVDHICPNTIRNTAEGLEGDDKHQITLEELNVMNLLLKKTKEFLDGIYVVEEYTRIDKLLEQYDDLVEKLIGLNEGLSRIEKRVNKDAILELEGKTLVRSEIMEFFKENMLGCIKTNNGGEEIYHTPDTSDYLGKYVIVETAINEIMILISILQTCAIDLVENAPPNVQWEDHTDNVICVDFGKK